MTYVEVPSIQGIHRVWYKRHKLLTAVPSLRRKRCEEQLIWIELQKIR